MRMPWKYVMPNDVESLRRREAAVGRIGAWWDAFAEKRPEIESHLAGQSQWDLKTWMDEQIAALHPRLRWEFGEDLGGRFLVITCEGAHHLRPMTETILRRAPELPGWSIREYRARIEPELVPPLVRTRTGQVMGTTTVQARMGHQRRIDFVYQSLLAGSNPDAALHVARTASDYLLGEDIAHRWAGHLDVAQMSHALTHSFIPLARVRSITLDLITAVLTDLPDRPYWRMPKLEPMEVKFRPQKQVDYAGQDDAMFGTTIIPELREAGVAPGFDSCRFSRQGETFCYLKLDASDADLDERHKRKKIIEEAMDAELRENGVGAVVGSATGRKYMYLDLAVADVVKTLELTRRRLLALELLPVRSWLMFYDAELAGEYIGLRSATPRPPMWSEPQEAEPPPSDRPPTPAPVLSSEDDPKTDGGPDTPSWLIDPLSP